MTKDGSTRQKRPEGSGSDVGRSDTEGSVAIHEGSSGVWRTGRARNDPAEPRGRGLLVGARRDARRLLQQPGPGPLSGLPIVGFVDAGHPPDLQAAGSAAAIWPSIPRPTLFPSWAARSARRAGRPRPGHPRGRGRPGRNQDALLPRVAQLSNSDVAVHWVLSIRTGSTWARWPSVATSESQRSQTRSRRWWQAGLRWLGSIDGARLAKRGFDVVSRRLALAGALSAVRRGRRWPFCSPRAGRSSTRRSGWGRGAGSSGSSSSAACDATPRARPARSGPRTTTAAAPGSATGCGTPTSTSCPSSSTS